MKKAFDQTFRDIKRGVNKNVLKVPSIEQKVLDATSNEPWGPHGSLLADIAQATRNYQEYQMIMSVLWKRVNDTGKNWRHVYKALTILDYLVAHGSERVIDEIREHAYQISTLSDFQYIDSSGRDQGNNVRKKSQSLVVLVNDKERILEVRQKAAANKDKFRSTPMGGMYRPGSGGYGDRYGGVDDRNGYGREREWGSRDDDRYGRDGESYGRDRDRYGRDNEERFGRDGYRDDDYRGRAQSIDDYNYGSRSRSADPERNRANEDDGQYSSRGSGAKADEQSQDGSYTGKKLESRYSGQSFDAPPSYEDAVGATHSPSDNERDGEFSQAYAPKASSPKDASPNPTTAAVPQPVHASPPASAFPNVSNQTTAQHSNQEVGGFDEFDPRGSFPAAPATSNGIAPGTSSLEMDLLGSLSEPFSSNPLALVPASQPYAASEANPPASFNSGSKVVDASLPPTVNNQPFDDPFGDGPFRAVISPDGAPTEQQINTSTNSFTANSSHSLAAPQPAPQNAATETGGAFYNPTNVPSGPLATQPTTSTPSPQQESSTPNHDIDILADILPPSAPPSFANAQNGYPVAPNQSVPHNGFPPQTNQPPLQPSIAGQNAVQNGFQAQTGQPTGYPLQPNYPQPADSAPHPGYPSQAMVLASPLQAGQAPPSGFHPQSGHMQPNSNFYGAYQPQPVSTAPAGGYMAHPSSTGPTAHQNFLSNSGSAVPVASHMGMQAPQVQTSSLVAPPLVSQTSTGYSAVAPKPSSDKFETKSTVWADTLSRGLVNLNISGSKTNPLADIGVDFDAINRKEKRMEKQPATSIATSTVSMGKAMGSGSGIGRAGAGALRPQPNPMMGPGMNYNTAARPGIGMGMSGYGGNHAVGRGMGMGIGMGMNMGMGTGMGQMPNMQQPMVPPTSTIPGGYNPTNYGQQPYGGYR